MPHGKKLIIVDDVPVDRRLKDYFAKFDYQIVHYTHLSQLNPESESAAALLISWSLLQEASTMITTFYHRYPSPLIIISDAGNEEACIRMLEAGADDFLVKPIHPRELHARIGAISRRVQRSQKEMEEERSVLTFSNLRLYPASRQLFDEKQKELLLSVGEYDLLLAFIKQPQRVLDREFLLHMTKNTDLTPFDRRIDVQISRLRQKIETDAKRPALIKTIRNRGYLFTSTVVSVKECVKQI